MISKKLDVYHKYRSLLQEDLRKEFIVMTLFFVKERIFDFCYISKALNLSLILF